MKKLVVIWFSLFMIFMPLVSSKVYADSANPYVAKYLFYKNGEKYNKEVNFTISHYGNDFDPYSGEGTKEISLRWENENTCDKFGCEFLEIRSLHGGEDSYYNIDIESADGDKMTIEKYLVYNDFINKSDKRVHLDPPKGKDYYFIEEDGSDGVIISSYILFAFDLDKREQIDVDPESIDLESLEVKEENYGEGGNDTILNGPADNYTVEDESSSGQDKDSQKEESYVISSDASEGSKDYMDMLNEKTNEELKTELNSLLWKMAYIYVVAFMLGGVIGFFGAYYLIKGKKINFRKIFNRREVGDA